MSRLSNFKIRAAVVVLLGAVSSISALAATGKLAITVTDGDGSGMSQAYVLVHSDAGKGSDLRMTADQAGKFEADLQPGIYSVFISAGGYAPVCVAVSITENKLVHFSRKLKADFKHMED